MLTQYYKILGSGTITDPKVKEGQFIIGINENEKNILGFVFKVGTVSIDVVLWEPADVGEHPNIISMSHALTPKDIEEFITELLTANLDMIPLWQRAADANLFRTDDYTKLDKNKKNFKVLGYNDSTE